MEPRDIEDKVNQMLRHAYEAGVGLPVINLHPHEYHLLMQGNLAQQYMLYSTPYQSRRNVNEFVYHSPYGEVKIEPSRDVPRGLGRYTVSELEESYKSQAKNHEIYKILKARRWHTD